MAAFLVEGFLCSGYRMVSLQGWPREGVGKLGKSLVVSEDKKPGAFTKF